MKAITDACDLDCGQYYILVCYVISATQELSRYIARLPGLHIPPFLGTVAGTREIDLIYSTMRRPNSAILFMALRSRCLGDHAGCP